jgi:hypothetical protein
VVGAVPVLPPPKLQALNKHTRKRLHRLKTSPEGENKAGERRKCV